MNFLNKVLKLFNKAKDFSEKNKLNERADWLSSKEFSDKLLE